jgi:hypothetical protein
VTDDTRRPEGENDNEPVEPPTDENEPVEPPTGEGEVVGADWLISQLDAAPTGQFDTRKAPDGDEETGPRPGRAGDNPVLAWWREKLIAADGLVNPEPRPGVDDVEDAKNADTVENVGTVHAEDVEDVEAAAAEPARFESRRAEKAEPEPPAEPETAFLPEPAFLAEDAATPAPASDDDSADATTDGDRADEVPADAFDDRSWSLGSDLSLDRDPEDELQDEAETGLIPSFEPPLFKPRSARDHVVEEPEQPDLPVPVGLPEPADDADRITPVSAFEPDQRADEKAQIEPDAEGSPEYVTEDLDNFSWKLTANDQLDPRVHRAGADAGGAAAMSPGDDSARTTDDGAEADADEAPTLRQNRIEPEQQAGPPEPAVIPIPEPEPEVSGPRRRTFSAAASTSEPAVATPSAAKPARPPLRVALPSARQAPRPVVLAAIGIVALLVLGGLFFAGSLLPGLLAGPAPTTAASPSPTATPAPSTPAAPVGPAAPGEQKWTALGGGECIEPYATPWAETFTVVDCADPHAAQMIFTGPVNEDPAAAYPGEDAILSQIYLWCSAPGVLDGDAASGYSDLQVQGTYPVSEEQWNDGQRSYYCFVNRSSGEPLTGSIAAAQS